MTVARRFIAGSSSDFSNTPIRPYAHTFFARTHAANTNAPTTNERQDWDRKQLYCGRSFPVDVIVNLPCLTPLTAIRCSATPLITEAFPRTTSTSRQLW
jgi:hypothetical protein